MKKLCFSILLVMLVLNACAPGGVQPTTSGQTTSLPAAVNPAGASTLNVMVHDSFSVSADVVKQFEDTNNVKVNFLKSGDAGTMLNRAVLTKNAPQADVMYGVDNTFLSRALENDVFEAYNSPQLKSIPSVFQLDLQNQALPVDYGDVCINYDKAYFAEKKIAIPQTLDDLLKPDYKGLLVMENPATSSTGLAFLMATIAHYGPQKYLDFWTGLRANGVVAVNDWETAYYTNFSGSSGKGAQPMVVSYASSPAAEVVYAKEPPSDSPTASITGPDTCFRQIEFVGILKGTKNRALAEKFVDFMLSPAFQKDEPLQMFVYPVVTDTALPPEFTKFAQVPSQPATLAPDDIAKNREQWIAAWKKAVLD